MYCGAAGRISLDVESPALTIDSFGWIASMTKLITTTAAMQLVEQGLITLDQDVRSLVPELNTLDIIRGFDADDKPIVEKNTNSVTLRYVSRT